MLLRKEDDDRFRALARELLSSGLPIMAHNGAGIAAAEFINDTGRYLQRVIDEEYDRLGHVRNLLLPVNRMPAVILQSVSMYLPFYERVRLATVCSHWSKVLHGYPGVWLNPVLVMSEIPSLGDLDVPTLLRLSSNKLKSLTIGVRSDSRAEDAASLIKECIGNLCNLTVSVPLGTWAAFHDAGGLASPAPRLESLVISTVTDNNVYILPSELFGNSAPRLRKLVLDCSILPYDDETGPTVAAFIGVRSIAYRGLASLNVKQFSALMRTCPQLEDLFVMPTIHMTTTDQPTWTLPVTMRRLTVQYSVQRRDNVFEFIARALRKTGELAVVEPWVGIAEGMFVHGGPIVGVSIAWVGSTETLVMSLRNARGGRQTAARVDISTANRLIQGNLSFLTGITTLTIPDTTWMTLCEHSKSGQWPNLRSLQVHIAVFQDPALPYTRLLILQEPSLASVCPVLVDLGLFHDARRGRGSYTYISVRAADLLFWLGSCKTVKTLTLQGIIAREPSIETLKDKVKVLVEPLRPEDMRPGEQEESWYTWSFPIDQSYSI